METGLIQWSPGVTLENIEKQVILIAFQHFKQKTATANALGIAIRTLDNKLAQYKAEAEEEERKRVARQRTTEGWLARQRGNVPNYLEGSGVVITGPAKRADPERVLANAGMGMESAPPAPAQSAMSMPEREAVQGVLPKDAPKGGTGKGR